MASVKSWGQMPTKQWAGSNVHPVLKYLMQKVKGCLHKKISGQIICWKQSI